MSSRDAILGRIRTELADVVEAASRTLKEPTPQHLKTLVHKLIFMRLEEHELDNSELTMHDFFEIEQSFSRTLSTQIFHGRVPYPDKEKKENGKLKENGKRKENGKPKENNKNNNQNNDQNSNQDK